MTKAPSSHRFRIPVRFFDGAWECSFGGPIPVSDRTEGELLVDRQSITDGSFLEMMEQRREHKLLDAGATLLIAMTVRPENPPPNEFISVLRPYDAYRVLTPAESLRYWSRESLSFVEVTLGGESREPAPTEEASRAGLWLLTEGIEPIAIVSGPVLLPEVVSADPVASLNHAFTKLSEIYETWRLSHTGNIYSRVLFQDSGGWWCPLEELRRNALNLVEQETRALFQQRLSQEKQS